VSSSKTALDDSADNQVAARRSKRRVRLQSALGLLLLDCFLAWLATLSIAHYLAGQWPLGLGTVLHDGGLGLLASVYGTNLAPAFVAARATLPLWALALGVRELGIAAAGLSHAAENERLFTVSVRFCGRILALRGIALLVQSAWIGVVILLGLWLTPSETDGMHPRMEWLPIAVALFVAIFTGCLIGCLHDQVWARAICFPERRLVVHWRALRQAGIGRTWLIAIRRWLERLPPILMLLGAAWVSAFAPESRGLAWAGASIAVLAALGRILVRLDYLGAVIDTVER
jgi:hypothetical protein